MFLSISVNSRQFLSMLFIFKSVLRRSFWCLLISCSISTAFSTLVSSNYCILDFLFFAKTSVNSCHFWQLSANWIASLLFQLNEQSFFLKKSANPANFGHFYLRSSNFAKTEKYFLPISGISGNFYWKKKNCLNFLEKFFSSIFFVRKSFNFWQFLSISGNFCQFLSIFLGICHFWQ